MVMMNGSQFFETIEHLYSLRAQDDAFQAALAELREVFSAVELEEEAPAPESDFPDWLVFRERYASALDGSHFCAHYFELPKVVLDKASEVFVKLDSFVANKDVDESVLERFVQKLKEEGVVSRSVPIVSPAWKAKHFPDETPYHLKLVLHLDAPLLMNAGLVQREDALLMKRHGGTQIQFAAVPEKAVERSEESTFVLTLWVYVSKQKPHQKRVGFGTGYVGSKLPFEGIGGSLMNALQQPNSTKEQLVELLGAFLDGVQESNLMFALLRDNVPKLPSV